MSSEDRIFTDFKPRRRTMWTAVTLNGAVLAALLVFPWVRGMLRASEAKARTVELSVCLWGARPVASPGLGLPEGEQERYGATYREADAGWPARCRPILGTIVPPPATLLLPGASRAEAQVREAVAMVDEHLAADYPRGPHAPVPSNPRLAALRLHASVAELVRHNGIDIDLAAPMFAVGGAVAPRPTRVPLQAASDAEVVARPRGDGMDAVAIDGAGVSWVRVAAGAMAQRRQSRPGLVRGALATDSGPWLVWAMPQERCAADPQRCATRTTGVAALDPESEALPLPRWLGAHPDGRLDRSVRIAPGRAFVLARTPDGRELREFALPVEPAAADEPPRAPSSTTALPPGPAALLPGLRARVAVVVADAEADGATDRPASRLLAIDPSSPDATDVGRLPGGAPWLLGCASGETTWIAWGTDAAAASVRLADGAPAQVAALPAVRVMLDARAAVADGARLVCGPDRADLVVLEEGALRSISCDGARCREARPIGSDVVHFDAVRESGRTVLAFSGGAALGQILTAVFDGTDATLAVPAPCYSREGGLCGRPMLAAAAGRVILGAREDADLLLLESTEALPSWRPMAGLR